MCGWGIFGSTILEKLSGILKNLLHEVMATPTALFLI